MPHIDTYRKRAKLLQRWHRERNYSVGGKVRQLDRFHSLTDAEALAMPMPLALAQEIIAVDAGYPGWTALKADIGEVARSPAPERGPPQAVGVVPILFVRDVTAAAGYYVEKLGFTCDFLHGHPPFYGAVSRDQACLHLRLVHRPSFAELAKTQVELILASVEVSNVWSLYEEVRAKGAEIARPLHKEAWGGTDFFVRDPDGNAISFVTYDRG